MMGTTQSAWVDPSNAEQARAWDGDAGAYWAANAARFDEAVAAYHRPFLDAAGIGATDRVLDIGCGTARPRGMRHGPPSPGRHWAWTSRRG